MNKGVYMGTANVKGKIEQTLHFGDIHRSATPEW